MKSMPLVAATALAGLAVALAAGASPAKADFIFGQLTPTPACGPVSGPGSVCAPDETFTSAGQTVVAHGFLMGPLNTAGTANLTLKPFALNGLSESGLGVQSNNTSTTCTNPDCEILSPQSVSVTASTSIITDALIGSVQPGETFNFFVENTLGVFTLLASNVTLSGGTCNNGMMGFSSPGTDLCRWDAPPGQTRFGVAVQAVATTDFPNGDILLTSVSTVLAPIVGAGLPGLVAACGGLFALARRRRKFVA
jgi:hypothetical protein